MILTGVIGGVVILMVVGLFLTVVMHGRWPGRDRLPTWALITAGFVLGAGVGWGLYFNVIHPLWFDQ